MRSCLIADDHALVREALAATVAARWPAAVIVAAADFPSAWAAAARGVDLCLADLAMPGAAPLAGVEGLRAAAPAMPIIVVTGSHDDAEMLELLASGVAGFAAKTSPAEVIAAAIALVLAGGRYLPPRLAQLHLPTAVPATGSVPAPRLLSPRQLEVARLMARGQTNKDIARTLGVAPATIKTHVAQVIALTGAANRTEASRRASDLGLL